MYSAPANPVELAAGIDALYLSARGEVPPALVDDLTVLKDLARELDHPVDATLAGYPVRVLGNGWGKYAFCFVHELARVGVTISDKLPSVRFQPTSRALHTVGPHTTVLWARNLLDALGIDASLWLSRLDLHSDWQGIWIEPDERSNFVTHSDRRSLYEVGEALSGLNFGRRGGALYARIYDKTREAEGKGDDWWHEVWGPQFNPERPVLRVEFEFTRDGLREFGVNTPEDAFENVGPLWAYATVKWLSLRSPTSDETRARWPVDERWKAVQASCLTGNSLPADRMRAGKAAGDLRRMLPQLVGYLTGAAVPLGASDLDTTFDALRPHIHAYCNHRGTSFDHKIAEKRQQS